MNIKKTLFAAALALICGPFAAWSQVDWNKDPVAGVQAMLRRRPLLSERIPAALLGALRSASGDWWPELKPASNIFNAGASRIHVDGSEWENGRIDVYIDVSQKTGRSGRAGPDADYCLDSKNPCVTYIFGFSQLALRRLPSGQGSDVLYKGQVVGHAAARNDDEPDAGVVDVAFSNGYKLRQEFDCQAGQTSGCALSVFLKK
ncbi:MAG TPA: hypothetical protein VNH15_03230 [Elusimicrobiota bacterium]|nr:hypothetical protein [Elusimicrobiota bacterium]